jgi:hypothetical protein
MTQSCTPYTFRRKFVDLADAGDPAGLAFLALSEYDQQTVIRACLRLSAVGKSMGEQSAIELLVKLASLEHLKTLSRNDEEAVYRLKVSGVSGYQPLTTKPRQGKSATPNPPSPLS